MSSSTWRVVLTVVLCTGLLIIWQYLFGPPPRPPAPADSGTAAPAERGGSAARPASRPVDTGEGKAPAARATTRPAGSGPLAKTVEGQLTRLELEYATAVFSSTGATLRHFMLKDPRYRERREGQLVPIDLVQTTAGEGPWQLVTTFPDSEFALPPDARFERVSHDARGVRYLWQSDKVRVSKDYRVDAERPLLWLTLTVRNLTDRVLSGRLRLALHSQQDPSQGQAGFANPYPRLATSLCFVNAELQRRNVGAITGEQSGCSAAGCGMGEGPVSQVGEVKWIGTDDRYFLTAAVPRGGVGDRRCQLRKLEGREVVEASMLYPESKIAAGKTQTIKFAIFVGPKDLEQLDTVVAAGGGEAQLGQSIEFGSWLQFIARPMLWLLKVFFGLFGNWGVAIILLTLVVKLLTLYPTQKSMQSMKRMTKLKPKMDELRERYKDDKQRLNNEMMSLYRVHKVNPFGGCLPMLIQMPIWFALYRTLGNSVELYRSPFGGWITDLTAPDPYYVLPIAMGLSMFAQQAITPQPMTGSQAKMMKYFMPGMFTVMMLWLPSGLTLYIFVNTLLTFGHQWYMNKSDSDGELKGAATAAKQAPAATSARPREAGRVTASARAARPATGGNPAVAGAGAPRPKKGKRRRRRTKKS